MPLPATADKKTVDFVVKFCITNLTAFKLEKIVLMGSRASGNPRPNSDHDFMAIVGDAAPDNIRTGEKLHDQIFSKLNKERTIEGLGAIDLFVTRSTRFQEAEPGTAPYKARTTGVVVFFAS